jgi:hypothetical protein
VRADIVIKRLKCILSGRRALSTSLAWKALYPSAHYVDVVIKSKGIVPTEE